MTPDVVNSHDTSAMHGVDHSSRWYKAGQSGAVVSSLTLLAFHLVQSTRFLD